MKERNKSAVTTHVNDIRIDVSSQRASSGVTVRGGYQCSLMFSYPGHAANQTFVGRKGSAAKSVIRANEVSSTYSCGAAGDSNRAVIVPRGASGARRSAQAALRLLSVGGCRRKGPRPVRPLSGTTHLTKVRFRLRLVSKGNVRQSPDGGSAGAARKKIMIQARRCFSCGKSFRSVALT